MMDPDELSPDRWYVVTHWDGTQDEVEYCGRIADGRHWFRSPIPGGVGRGNYHEWWRTDEEVRQYGLPTPRDDRVRYGPGLHRQAQPGGCAMAEDDVIREEVYFIFQETNSHPVGRYKTVEEAEAKAASLLTNNIPTFVMKATRFTTQRLEKDRGY